MLNNIRAGQTQQVSQELKSAIVKKFTNYFLLLFSLIFIIEASHPEVYAQVADQQILLRLGQNEVDVYEFQRLYQKNAQTTGSENPLVVEDYLGLFINFKRKVFDAHELGLDTLQSFKNELAGYKNQLATPYLTNQKILDSLTWEAYERMQTEINASHILVKLPPNPEPADTLKAYKKALSIRERILVTGEPFDLVAKGVSDDPSAKTNSGNLGYFPVFQMTYPFESACYNAEINELTHPIRTRFGYHLIKVHDKRKARGTIKVAHIMVSVPRSSTREFESQARQKIFGIYDRLLDGAAFSELAKEFSDDYNSAKMGGELPWFGTGRMVPEFEAAAFSLKTNGELSEPVKTGFGWHIIKRLDRREVESFETIKDELRREVLRTDRAQIARQAFLDDLKNEYDLRVDSSMLYPFYMAIDSQSFISGTWGKKITTDLDRPLIEFANLAYSVRNFKEFINNHAGRPFSGTSRSFVDNLMVLFENQKLTEYEKNHLETKNKDFYYLIKEYHDGMLLFEVSEKKVWSKAIEDTVGLRKFYESHLEDYMKEACVNLIQFSIHDSNWTARIQKAIRKGRKKSYDPAYFYGLLPADSSYVPFEFSEQKVCRSDSPVVDDMHWRKGATKTYSDDGQINIILITDVHPPEPEPFDSIRGQVTSDFQNALEEDWLKFLEEKYPLELHQDVFNVLKSNLQ